MHLTIGPIIAFLTACTVGPNYVKPTTEVPAAYKEMNGWKVAQPKEEVMRGAWWEIFNDPELNGLEEQVAISNQNVAVAEAYSVRPVPKSRLQGQGTIRR